jgi:transposase
MIKLSDVKVRPQYRTRVRYRLLVLEYTWQHGPAAAGRHYGLSARTIRRWRKRWRRGGVEGLVPAYPRHRARRVPPAAVELIRQARQELGYGAARARLWLQRVHGVRLAMGTIQRVFRDIGLPRLRRTRKREPRQMKLFEKAEPGESIQVDVKYVQIAGHWAFQYTALDDCTRFRVLRLYRRLNHRSSLVLIRLRPGGRSRRDPAPVHSAPPAATERQSRAEPSDRSGGVLGPTTVPELRGGHCRPSGLGDQVQL